MDNRFDHALSIVPPAVADYLHTMLYSEHFDATISAQQFAELQQLSGLHDSELRVALLPFAAAYSHTPISHFNVGAICRGLSGRLYFGANIEFADIPLSQTVHAEQCAISHAWMKGENGVKDITVNYSPCGHCRQFMNELSTADDLKIQLPEKKEQTLQHYLPESFGPADLNIHDRLMKSSPHTYLVPDDDLLLFNAVEAMNKSYAPYTHNHSGVALQLASGKIYTGSYAENAAFNPSLPPLQVALLLMLLDGYSFSQIRRVALAESSVGSVTHLGGTQTILDSIDPDITLEYLSLDVPAT